MMPYRHNHPSYDVVPDNGPPAWGIYCDGSLVRACTTRANAESIAANLSSGRFSEYRRNELTIRRLQGVV